MAVADTNLTTPHPDSVERGTPTVMVNDLYVTYRVQGSLTSGSGQSSSSGSAVDALRRIIRRRPAPGVQYIKAVRGVSFTAYEGDAVGLIGRNGSGKSTLLQAIAGLVPLTKGQVFTSATPALLGVNAALMPQLTGERNIELGSLALGLTPAEAEARKADIIEFAGIGDFVSLPMKTYSSGMSARLRFAIAASVNHDILLIDEALGTGDAEFQRKSQERIQQLRGEAGTVFLVTHSSATVRETCNRAIWLEQGKIIMDGDVTSVVDAYDADVASAVSTSANRQAGAAT
jgi:teichoic acid transport system ATP-binding protein